MLVEIIVTNLAEALLAESLGADRLELIDSFALGGLSPALELSREVCAAVNIPVNVMVRPHGNSFVYSAADMLVIQREIDYLLTQTKVSSLVFGSLTVAEELDFNQLEQVLKQIESQLVGLTFHRAIDVCRNPLAGFIELQNYPQRVSRVLSSGGAATAHEGSSILRAMCEAVRSTGPRVLAGSGVTPENAREVVALTGVDEIHLGTGVRKSGQLAAERFAQLLSQF